MKVFFLMMAFAVTQPDSGPGVAYALANVPDCERSTVIAVAASTYDETVKEHGTVEGFGYQCVEVEVKPAYGV